MWLSNLLPSLLPDWRLAWRFLSVQASLLLFVLSLVQADVLPLVRPLVPVDRWPLVSGGLAMAIVVLRLIAQPRVEIARMDAELDALEAYGEKTLSPGHPSRGPGQFHSMLGLYLVAVGFAVFAMLAVLFMLAWGKP